MSRILFVGLVVAVVGP